MLIRVMYIILGVLLFISFLCQFIWFEGVGSHFIGGLIPNFITELLGIIVTIFVVDRLVDLNNKKEEKRILTDVLGNQFQSFVSAMCNEYLYFVLKEPPRTGDSTLHSFKQTISEILDNMDKYVREDFMLKPIKVLIFNPTDMFKPSEKVVDYQVYCEMNFKANMSKLINEFLGRYISVLPRETRYSIFKISDDLKSNILLTLIPYGISMDMNRGSYDLTALQSPIKSIGKELRSLLELCL